MTRHQPTRGRKYFGLLLLLWLAVPFLLLVPPPAWWAERGATNANPPDDYAAANLGQLKQMAVKARDELNARLPGGAGQPIEDLIAGWNQPSPARDDHAAATLGQLKYVGKLFWDRLLATGYTDRYPWTDSTNPPDDTAIANLGQVKRSLPSAFSRTAMAVRMRTPMPTASRMIGKCSTSATWATMPTPPPPAIRA